VSPPRPPLSTDNTILLLCSSPSGGATCSFDDRRTKILGIVRYISRRLLVGFIWSVLSLMVVTGRTVLFFIRNYSSSSHDFGACTSSYFAYSRRHTFVSCVQNASIRRAARVDERCVRTYVSRNGFLGRDRTIKKRATRSTCGRQSTKNSAI